MIDELEISPAIETLAEVLRHRAGEEPDRLAYTFLVDGEAEGGRLTFGELDTRSRRLAAVLLESATPGSRVLLLLPPGLEFAVAFLACLNAGLVAVPAYPPRSPRALPRLRSIIEDSEPAIALTTAELGERTRRWWRRDGQPPALAWLNVEEAQGGALTADLLPRVAGDTPAFLQYTSGSTSTPKGVVVSHRNLVHNQELIRNACEHSARSVFVSWLPLYHDLGLIGNLLQALYVGASCVLMSPMAFLQRPMRWLEAISRYGATTSGGPNFAYELCRRKSSPAERQKLDLSRWRIAFNGAEPVRSDTLKRFAEAFAEAGFQRRAFYPCYGLAESTLMVSGGRPDGSPVIGYFDGEALEHDRAVPTLPEVAGSRALVGCGRVLGGQRLAILSGADGRRLKPGAIGEIVVAGGSVASGYWNRPEDTAQTFVSFPNAPDLGRVLRTGDLGFVHDGELFITGRLKDLIIVRGRNLYPQDVERTAESSHPELLADGGAAFSVEVEGEERLVVVHEMARRRQQQPQRVAESVRRAVAEEHEVQPWEVVLIRTGTLPKTTSGKVQRGVCRQQYLEGSLRLLGRSRPLAAAPEPAAPEVDLEALDRLSPSERRQVVTSRLGLLTARVLRLEEAPAPDVALTALGLDSLAAVKLQQAAESDLGAELPLSRLLAGASLEQLAPATSEQVSRRRDVAEPVVAASADSTFQLSHGQQALWFLHRLAPESPAYIIAGAARAPSGLDATRLRKAAEALTARHPALRTTFTQPAGGDPVQRVHTELPPAFEQHDATSWSATFLSRQLLEEAERPFDLEQGPLIRFGVFREASGADLLLLAAHHLVADFWSLAVLMRELGALYSGDRPESLPKLARDYRDYVVRQRAMVEGPQGQRLLEGWRRQLADLPAELTLPSDRPRPAVQSYRGNTLTTRLGADLTQRLLALSNAQGATLFVTLLAGFQALLARYCNGQLPPVGTPTAGRNDRDFAELVGYFVNPVVLRADPSGDPTASEWLSRVRRVALEAFDHQSYPFALLAEQLRPVRDPSRSPLFQVMFALHVAPRSAEQALAALALGLPGTRLELGELKLESTSALRWRGAQFDLTLTAGRVTVGQDDSIAATLEYNTDLFDRPTIARIAAHFETLLEALAAAPEHKLSALPLLTSAERHQLILGWNDGCDPEGAAVPVHQRFAEQARCRPQATALADGGHAWTYEQLDEASNRLARHLQGLGVGPEARVAIGLERSPQQVLAILGVLKAGGAYVPLDPAYPAARLSFLVESSAPVLLITRRALRDRLPALPGRPPVLLDDLAALDSHSSDPNAAPRAALETEHPAYVLYTSGSTGRPKGVSVPHHALACHAAATAECYGLGPTDRVLQFAAVGFDVAAEELFPTWIAGGSVWPAPDPLPAPADFSSFVERHRLTVLNLPASYWREWLTEMIRAEQEPPACLRLMVVGSEAVAASDLQQWQRLAGARIAWHNAYGVTETTITSTIYTPSNDAPAGATPVPIGRPLPGTHAYVVDHAGRSLPATMHGELWLGGSGVARGYPGLPARTAERFTPDPFAGIRGARL
ncbi:MAG: amino acid adenylation domain-containing protein, partial [Acidobacteriota bacterium]